MTAAKYQIEAGGTLTLSSAEASAGVPAAQPVRLTVSGLVKASRDPFLAGMPQLYTVPATAAGFAPFPAGGESGPSYLSIQLDAAPGQAAALQEAVRASLSAAGFPQATVNTAAEETTALVAGFTGGTDQLTIVLLAFAAVALLVAGLVVSNTFSVLIAQRTRELALLRCIGADRGQIRRSVLVEALLVGLLSSVIGILLATGLMAAVIGWLQRRPETEFATLAVPPSAVVVSLLAGVLLTVLAALAPARAATAVAPLAALRPNVEATVRNRRGRVRLGLGLVLAAAGGALLVAGTVYRAAAARAARRCAVLCGGDPVRPAVRAAFGQRLWRPGPAAGRAGEAGSGERRPQPLPHRSHRLRAADRRDAGGHDDDRSGDGAHRLDSELAGHYPVDLTIGNETLDGRPLDAAVAATAERQRGVDGAALVTLGGWTEVQGSRTAAYQLAAEQPDRAAG